MAIANFVDPGSSRQPAAVTITALLKSSPGATARELVAAMRANGRPTDKAEVNSTLYSRPSEFWSDGSSPPHWHVVAGAQKPGSRLPRSTKISTASHALQRPKPIPAGRMPELYAWQQEAIDAWRLQRLQGVVEAVTGTGKTMVGLAAAAEALRLGGKVQVVVPRIELLRQWTEQVRQRLPAVRVGQLGGGGRDTLDSCQVLVSTVQSARSYAAGRLPANSLLVADECHRYGAEGFAKALNELFGHRLGLSATYARSDDGNDSYLDPYFGGTCFEMNYARAIRDEVTAHFKVALIAVRFAGGERSAYDEADSKASTARQWLIQHGEVRAEPFGEFMKDVCALAEGGGEQATRRARSYLSAFTERKRILAETPAKRTRLKALVPAIRSADRSIVFTQTIAAAEDAVQILRVDGLTAEAIHSKLDDEGRYLMLSRFAEGRLKAIAAPQLLDEGVDVPAADLAIILAASSSRRQMVQRMGRVLRRKADGRLARLAILYVEGTSEDPANGAHGAFLEEVTSVADRVQHFGSAASANDVSGFLSDFRSGRVQPPARMANQDAKKGANRKTTPAALRKPRSSGSGQGR